MSFAGFSKDTVQFLSALRKNNDKKWFDAHRHDYEASFVEPAKSFIDALGPRLRKLDANIHAEPRVNGSILRINRDVRFSKDKSPYKDHLDLWFWSGAEKGWDSSGFFFRLTPDKLILGTGMHGFAPPMLARYRAAVLAPKSGEALARLVEKLRKAGYEVGTESFKKAPKGVPADHPRASLLRHGGLHAAWEGSHPKELHAPTFVNFAEKQFSAVNPLHRWLSEMA